MHETSKECREAFGERERSQPSTHFDDLPDVLTVREAALVSRVSEGTMYDQLRNGSVYGVRLGGRWLVPKQTLQQKFEPAEKLEAMHE